MSFPLGPTNGQTATLNGIVYTYDSTNQAWTRTSPLLNLSGTASAFAISNTATSTSTTTGALTVAGGVGVGGNIYFGGNLYQNGVLFTGGGGTTTGTTTTFVISNLTSTTSTNTGALQVTGGAGIGGGVYVGGVITATSFITSGATGTGYITGAAFISATTATIIGTNASTSTNTGALIVTGGVGIGGNINFGGNLYQNGVLFTGVSTSTTSTFLISNTTTSTSTNTGALQVYGGAGIGGNLNVGGNIAGGGVRTSSTSTPPVNPTVGDIWYNTTTDDIYRYTTDGTTSAWLDITGPSGATSSVTSSAQPIFSATNTGSQTLASGPTVKIQFNVKLVDTNNNYDATTNYRFTPTVAGYYQINAAIRDNTGGTAGQIAVWIYKNGSAYASSVNPNSGQGLTSQVTQVVYCNGTTDYIEIYGLQTLGISMNIGGDYIRAYFSGFYVGTGIGYVNGTNTYNGVAQILSAAPLTAPLIKDSTGTEIARFCLAWCKFSSSASPTVTSGFNVSSITYTATGRWTVNFTNALPTASYVGFVSPDGNYALTTGIIGGQTTTGCPIYVTTTGGAGYNPGILYVGFFA
jgi:hypothetical protein